MIYTGTKSTGIKLPIIKKGDNLVNIVVNSIEDAVENNEISELHNRDVIGLTESIVARAQGNYVTVDDIADSITEQYFKDFMGKKELAVVFPIMSRNRFSVILRGIARACDKISVWLKAPCDEVGNVLIDDWDWLSSEQIVSDSFIYKHYNYKPHKFTGIDYMKLYREIIESEGCQANIVVSPYCERVIDYCHNILCADIHTKQQTKDKITAEFMKHNIIDFTVLTLSDLCTYSTNGEGYNYEYGLLGSNKMSDDTLKLFPRDCTEICYKIQAEIKNRFNVDVEVMVYGDGAFKDPVCGIWELADPVVAPGYTSGLEGTPNELKLKYLADNDFSNLSGFAAEAAIREAIKTKDANLKGSMSTQGTTPRRYVDLLGSLCDLTSGSGDKGTPVVLIQNYFNNYAD